MKRKYEIKKTTAKLDKLITLKRVIKNNRKDIQSETLKSHQLYILPQAAITAGMH